MSETAAGRRSPSPPPVPARWPPPWPRPRPEWRSCDEPAAEDDPVPALHRAAPRPGRARARRRLGRRRQEGPEAAPPLPGGAVRRRLGRALGAARRHRCTCSARARPSRSRRAPSTASGTAAPSSARAVWRTLPALRTLELFEDIDGLYRAGVVAPDEMPSVTMWATLLTEYRDVLRLAAKPAPAGPRRLRAARLLRPPPRLPPRRRELPAARDGHRVDPSQAPHAPVSLSAWGANFLPRDLYGCTCPRVAPCSPCS